MQFDQLKRREFITLISGVTAWPLAARAQQPTMPVIGILGSMAAADFAGYVTAFREGLDEADFVEGQNVAIEYRWANNQRDNYPKVLGACLRNMSEH
jgi:putative tryptophan/tyrosine transport system substrate-binding protein